MRIESVNVYPMVADVGGGSMNVARQAVSLPHATETSKLVFKEYRCVLVRIASDTGIIGVGECISRLAPEATAQIVDSLGSLLIGQDPHRVRFLWELMYGTMVNRGHRSGFFVEALSGIDIALWDLIGRDAGRPIYSLLGGPHSNDLWAYASSVRLWDGRSAIDTAARFCEAGFTAVKVKIGKDPIHPETELKTLASVCESIPDHVAVMVDANCAYDIGTATRVARTLEELDIYWFEEPLPPDDLAGYRRLAGSTGVRLAGGETEFTRYGFRALLNNRSHSVLQPDATRAGGISEAVTIGYMAASDRLPISPHVGMSSGVSIAANLQLSAALPNFLIFETMSEAWVPGSNSPFMTELVTRQDMVSGGIISLPSAPGLGIEVDWEFVHAHEIAWSA